MMFLGILHYVNKSLTHLYDCNTSLRIITLTIIIDYVTIFLSQKLC